MPALSALVFFSLILTTTTKTDSAISDKHVRADDPVLMTLIQQQAATIAQLQAEVVTLRDKLANLESKSTALEDSVTVLQHNVSAEQTNVAFTASLNAGSSINVGTHRAVVFDRVITNIGNGYDPHTGTFTAPVAGTYAFFFSVKAGNQDGEAHFGIQLGSRVIAEVDVVRNDGVIGKVSCFATTHVNAGELVEVRHTYGMSILDNWHSTMFSGFLISAD